MLFISEQMQICVNLEWGLLINNLLISMGIYQWLLVETSECIGCILHIQHQPAAYLHRRSHVSLLDA